MMNEGGGLEVNHDPSFLAMMYAQMARQRDGPGPSPLQQMTLVQENEENKENGEEDENWPDPDEELTAMQALAIKDAQTNGRGPNILSYVRGRRALVNGARLQEAGVRLL